MRLLNFSVCLSTTSKRQREDPSNDKRYLCSKLAMKVGIVGTGISGVVAGAHLKAAGIDVTVFERSDQAGGVW